MYANDLLEEAKAVQYWEKALEGEEVLRKLQKIGS